MEVNRPEYRTPREPRAVCVYTIAQESRHVIVENIPALGLVKDLVDKFSSFGNIAYYSMLDEHASSTETTDVFYIIYDEISNARKAKRMMDDKVFYTNRLRITYAPEYESPQDIRDKFNDRFQTIQKRCRHRKTDQVKVKKEIRKRQYGPLTEQDTLEPSTTTTIQKEETVETVKKRRRI